MVSWVVFVVMTAVEGTPGRASFVSAFWVAIAATASIPTSTAIGLFASAKGPRTTPSETRCQEGGLQDEGRLPRFVASPFERARQQRHRAQHDDEHRDRQKRTDLAEPTGEVMRGQDHDVTGDVRGEQAPKCKKDDHVDRASRRTENKQEQPAATPRPDPRSHQEASLSRAMTARTTGR